MTIDSDLGMMPNRKMMRNRLMGRLLGQLLRKSALASGWGLILSGLFVLTPNGWAEIEVRSEHPRIFLQAKEIPTLRQKLNGPLLPVWNALKEKIDASYDADRIKGIVNNSGYALHLGVSFAFGAVVATDPAQQKGYRDKALALARQILSRGLRGSTPARRHQLETLALIYDWLYPSLEENDRRALRAAIAQWYQSLNVKRSEQVSGHSHHTTKSKLIGLLAIYGEPTGPMSREEIAQALARNLDFYREYVRVYRWMASPASDGDPGGGFFLGWWYGRIYLAEMLLSFKAVQTATSINWLNAEAPWLKEVGYHLVYGLRPDQTYFPVGDAGKWLYYQAEYDLVAMPLLAAAYRNGHYQKFTQMALDWWSAPSKNASDASKLVWALLFYDPTVTAESLETLPTSRGFGRVGNYFMRSGWNFRDNRNRDGVIPGETMVLFQAPTFYHLNHQHKDWGNLLLFYQGPLTIDSGAYITGEANFYGGDHWQNYLTRTIAHNTILVVDPQEDFGMWKGTRGIFHHRVNDGGQEFKWYRDSNRQLHKEAWNLSDLVNRDDFKTGEVPIYEDADDYTYVVGQTGDETPGGYSAYKTGKVREFSRHVVFLKKGGGWPHPRVILFDRVTSGNPDFKKIWLLHTVSKPLLQEKFATITHAASVDLPDANQQNRYSGKLYSQTVLPSDAVLTPIGGVGQEFWVDGAQTSIPLSDRNALQEPGAWRIEVSPGAPRKTDLFLHLLSPLDADDPRPAPIGQLVETEGMIGTRTGEQLILFSKDGTTQPGVRYTVSHSGKLDHLITGLEKDVPYRVIRSNSMAIVPKSSTSNGSLFFTSIDGGTFDVQKSSVPPDPAPSPPIVLPSTTRFSEIPFFGDAANYLPRMTLRWSVAENPVGSGELRYFLNTAEHRGSGVNADLLGEIALIHNEGYLDFEMSAVAKRNKPTNDLDAGPSQSDDLAILFSYRDDGNYDFMLLSSRREYNQLVRVENGVRKAVLGTASKPLLTDDQYHRVQLHRVGDRVTVFRDGQEVLSATDTRPRPGRIGIGSLSDSAWFDDIEVKAPTPPEEVQPFKVLFEAEEAAILSAPMRILNSRTASGGSCIGVPNGSAGSKRGKAVFRFSVPKTGDYALWGRVIAPTQEDNSFHVLADGQPIDEDRADGTTTIWDLPVSSTWTWERVGMRSAVGQKKRVFSLSAGEHTLAIPQREDGTFLDQILITDQLNEAAGL